MDYAYSHITINGRHIAVNDIIAGYRGHDPFEQSTFNFIRRWFSKHDDFELNTSGSTGVPKKIIVMRQQMLASANATAIALHLQQGMKALVCLDTQ